jgi:hypothetical protein
VFLIQPEFWSAESATTIAAKITLRLLPLELLELGLPSELLGLELFLPSELLVLELSLRTAVVLERLQPSCRQQMGSAQTLELPEQIRVRRCSLLEQACSRLEPGCSTCCHRKMEISEG